MWESYKEYSEQVGASYDDHLIRESIERTHHIAHDRIGSFFPNNEVRLPDFVVPDGLTADQALIQLCVAGLKEAGMTEDKEYLERLKHEIKVIKKRGFSKYFLTMKAIADKAVESQLVGAGRGSAAGSLVSYVLGITQVDPLKYNLQFSRFLTEEGTGFPDIDYDVSAPMELKEQLIEEWGDSTVVPISNWNTLQLRSLIKDIGKFYNIPFTEVNYVTGRMMHEATPEAKKVNGIKSGVYVPTFEEVMAYSKSLQDFLKKYPQVKTHIDVLHGQIRSNSRHAGGVVIGENLDERMPLINSKGVRQTPWTEGQNVRHLEPMGFIKFDILGLASLRMMEEAIRHILKRHHNVPEPTFGDVKKFYDTQLHPDVIDLEDQEIYENIFQAGKFIGIFQFTEAGAQRLCQKIQPTSLVDIAACTSIYRPGPLGANVDKSYVEARRNPDSVEYPHEIYKEVTKDTAGFLIFQEQIAELAHKLGAGISLDEGNSLRKLLTKKGTDEVEGKKNKILKKFIEGCDQKKIDRAASRKIWDLFEYFSGYGFNLSHAISYSILSYQCAWLLNYYPSEWTASFLDKEPEKRKERAINLAKKNGFDIQPLEINSSGRVWEISKDGKTLIQPLTSVKGLGEAAIAQIIANRPFKNIEEFIFNENITYSKLNKKALDVLARSGTLSGLMDSRFSGAKHFWTAIAVDRPRKEKNLTENINRYHPEGDFTDEEKIQYLIDLTGVFPFDLVMDEHILSKLEEYCVPPLGEWDSELGVAWFIPREIIQKKTKNGKTYWIVKTIDSTSSAEAIKCWGVKPKKDNVVVNRPYLARLEYDEQWGFSTRSIRHNFRMLG
jgi:DNA polymerase-3 subunit alpha